MDPPPKIVPSSPNTSKHLDALVHVLQSTCSTEYFDPSETVGPHGGPSIWTPSQSSAEN